MLLQLRGYMAVRCAVRLLWVLGLLVALVWPTVWASVLVCGMHARLVVAHLLWASVSPSDITTGVHSGSWASMALTGDWLGRCCGPDEPSCLDTVAQWAGRVCYYPGSWSCGAGNLLRRYYGAEEQELSEASSVGFRPSCSSH